MMLCIKKKCYEKVKKDKLCKEHYEERENRLKNKVKKIKKVNKKICKIELCFGISSIKELCVKHYHILHYHKFIKRCCVGNCTNNTYHKNRAYCKKHYNLKLEYLNWSYKERLKEHVRKKGYKWHCLKCNQKCHSDGVLCYFHYCNERDSFNYPSKCWVKDCYNYPVSVVVKYKLSLCKCHNNARVRMKIERIFNREEVNRAERLNKKKRRVNNINYRLIECLRSRLSSIIKILKKNKLENNMVVKYLGCTVEELKNHLESKFQPGMSWENHGRKGWHIDHIYPVSKINFDNIEEVKKVCHYTNLQPLWAIDNIRKHNKI